jgi:ribosomal protein S18 acetylase RimI-like enzyme
MKLLFDTNILIPLEPTSSRDLSAASHAAMDLFCRAQEANLDVFLHPDAKKEIGRDRDTERRKMRETLLRKYPLLPDPPPVPSRVLKVLGNPPTGSNDWVDNHLLAAVLANAVDLLITEDRGIHKKAARLSVSDRVLTIDDALATVRGLFPVLPSSPPAVRDTKAHVLVPDDPIFDSIRKDYHPHFDKWFSKCRLEHRQTWAIPIPQSTHVKGFCIVNPEAKEDYSSYGKEGKILKICTLKVSEEYRGYRFGELLLKPVLAYTRANSYDWVFVTVFAKYDQLINLLHDFGFEEIDRETAVGEKILFKPIRWSGADKESLDPMRFSVRFGPGTMKLRKVPTYIVPIQPRYTRVLFPEGESQVEMFPGQHPFGNSIRKAYLCNASIRKIARGDGLLFYTSEIVKGITALGVVESTLVSDDPNEIARYAGKQTVYSYSEIESLCLTRPVLAILFRQVKVLETPISFRRLRARSILSGPPQSIQRMPEEAKAWLENLTGI